MKPFCKHPHLECVDLMRSSLAGMALPSDVPACGGCADKDCPSTRPVPGQAVALPPHVEVAIVEVSVGALQNLSGRPAT